MYISVGIAHLVLGGITLAAQAIPTISTHSTHDAFCIRWWRRGDLGGQPQPKHAVLFNAVLFNSQKN